MSYNTPGRDGSGGRPVKRPRTEEPQNSTSAANLTPQTAAVMKKDIAPTGDINFSFKNESTLRVHSVVLKLASPVFAAMFGPHFREGRKLCEADPTEVELPEDDPAAMALLCEVLHHRYDTTKLPQLKLFLALANLIDKYDCINTLRTQTDVWLSRFSSNPHVKETEERFILLKIAALVDQPLHFYTFSRDCILGCNGSFRTFDEDRLPADIRISLTESTIHAKLQLRESVFRDMMKFLHDFPTRGRQFAPICAYNAADRNCVDLVRSSLRSEGSPPLGLSFLAHLDHYTNVFIPGALRNCAAPANGKSIICGHCAQVPLDERLKARVRNTHASVMRQVEGLCLDCLKNDGKRPKGTLCRVRHNLCPW